MKNETWKPVVGYEGLYEVSDTGLVRSLNYNHTGGVQVLRPAKNIWGYLQVGLSKDGHEKKFKIHRLVAQAFIPNPHCLPEVNHIDEVKTNNTVCNLEWKSRIGNVRHGTGVQRSADTRSNPVLQIDLLTGEVVATFKSAREASRQTGINVGGISLVCNGKKKTSGGYFWRYA